MSSLIGGLFGAPQAASNAGSYYNTAMQNEISATGSPAAQTFVGAQDAVLRPLFSQQDSALTAQNAAEGIGSSGQGRANQGNLVADQSATLAGAAAPLYQSAMNAYGQINAEMPGAEEDAYNTAIQQGYEGLGDLASFAGLAFGGGGFNPGGAGVASGSGPPAGGYTGAGGGYFTQGGDSYMSG